jgi:DNA-binding LacI/PurR family transcriptional regulator
MIKLLNRSFDNRIHLEDIHEKKHPVIFINENEDHIQLCVRIENEYVSKKCAHILVECDNILN